MRSVNTVPGVSTRRVTPGLGGHAVPAHRRPFWAHTVCLSLQYGIRSTTRDVHPPCKTGCGPGGCARPQANGSVVEFRDPGITRSFDRKFPPLNGFLGTKPHHKLRKTCTMPLSSLLGQEGDQDFRLNDFSTRFSSDTDGIGALCRRAEGAQCPMRDCCAGGRPGAALPPVCDAGSVNAVNAYLLVSLCLQDRSRHTPASVCLSVCNQWPHPEL